MCEEWEEIVERQTRIN